MVHPAVAQFFGPFAFAQNVIPVTQPGAKESVDATTALVANAVLLVVLESPGFDIETLNVTLVPQAAGRGITGIRTVSDPSDTMLVVFVQVTVVPIWAPHVQPLSVSEVTGHEMVVGNVRTTV